MRAAKVQASLRIRAVSPEPPLLAQTSRESRGTFRQKPRSLAPLNGWACTIKICHDGMLEDANTLDAAHFIFVVHRVMTLLNYLNMFNVHDKYYVLSKHSVQNLMHFKYYCASFNSNDIWENLSSGVSDAVRLKPASQLQRQARVLKFCM